jgi:hypothetical protein
MLLGQLQPTQVMRRRRELGGSWCSCSRRGGGPGKVWRRVGISSDSIATSAGLVESRLHGTGLVCSRTTHTYTRCQFRYNKNAMAEVREAGGFGKSQKGSAHKEEVQISSAVRMTAGRMPDLPMSTHAWCMHIRRRDECISRELEQSPVLIMLL